MKMCFYVLRPLFLALFVLMLSGVASRSNAQSIVSIDPDSAYAGETVVVTITGEGTSFQSGDPVTEAVFLVQYSWTLLASEVLVHSPTLLDATFDLPTYISEEYEYDNYSIYIGSIDYPVVQYYGFRILTPPTAIENTGWGDIKTLFR